MSTADSSGPSLNGATAFRRLLFFLILISLSLYYLMVQFQGLSNPRGMEQASILAHEALRQAMGLGYTSEFESADPRLAVRERHVDFGR